MMALALSMKRGAHIGHMERTSSLLTIVHGLWSVEDIYILDYAGPRRAHKRRRRARRADDGELKTMRGV